MTGVVVTHTLTHSLTHSLAHSLTHSHTHSHTLWQEFETEEAVLDSFVQQILSFIE